MKGASRGNIIFLKPFGVALLCCLAFILAACSSADNVKTSGKMSGNRDEILIYTEGYARSFETAIPQGMSLKLSEGTKESRFTHELSQYAAVEAYDFQAAPLLEAYERFFWQPHYKVTVVIAIDRDRSDADIRSWEDLTGARQMVGITTGDPEFRLMICAISHALSGDFSLDQAMELFADIRQDGFLQLDGDFAPIQICLDNQAAQLKKQGRNIEIVIPKEGTLSFEKGFLANGELLLEENNAESLVSQGLRSVEGLSDSAIYPPEDDYGRAATLKDYHSFIAAGQSVLVRFRREALRVRLYSTADGREHMISAMAFIFLAIVWTGSMVTKVMSRQIRRWAFVVVLILTFWAILRILKYQTPEGSAINRYCWYGYYIFQIFLPVALLRIADLTGRWEDSPPPLWWKLCFGFNLALLLLVFTNDIHMQVFRLDVMSGSSSDYSYGPGYFLVFGGNVLCFISAIGLLLVKGWRSPRRYGMFVPVLMFLMALSYAVFYVLRIPFARESDFTITVGFFSLLFLQSAMMSGLIPVNAKYELLFACSPLAMEILDAGGKTVLRSASASAEAGAIMRVSSITGGLAVWQEDLSAIHRLQRELSVTIEQLEKTNDMLLYEHRIRSDMEKLSAQKIIQGELDSLLEDQLAQIGSLLESLRGDNAPDKEALAHIGLLLCYGKRRCNLMFWEKQNETMGFDELFAYLNELAEYAQAAGIACAIISDISDPSYTSKPREFCNDLKIEAAIGCYSFLFDGLRIAMKHGQRELICRMSIQGKGVLMQLMGDAPLRGIRLREDIAGGAIELREDGYLSQAALRIEGGCADA